MATELERYKDALRVAQNAMLDLKGAITIEQASDIHRRVLEDINIILNPVEYEDVEVVRWECPKCGTVYADKEGQPDHDTRSQSPEWGKCSCFRSLRSDDATKLTGTVRREKRVPKERSVSGKVAGRTGDNLEILLFGHNPPKPSLGSDVMVTWQEEP